MAEHPIVKVKQQWMSVRNGKHVTVLETKCFEFDGGGWAARVETRPGFGKWITIGKKGIVGYRLLDPLKD